jgi:predicted DNA-binding WGR domain protein
MRFTTEGQEMGTRLRWTSPTRHYTAAVHQDLFGDWVLVRSWGGQGSFRGGHRVRVAADREQALQWLSREARRRERRGYRLERPGGSSGRPRTGESADGPAELQLSLRREPRRPLTAIGATDLGMRAGDGQGLVASQTLRPSVVRLGQRDVLGIDSA